MRRLVGLLIVAAAVGAPAAFAGEASADTFVPAPGSPFATSAPKSVAVGDFDGDGKLDVAVLNGDVNGVSVLTGDGHGALQPVPGSPFATGATGSNSLAAADFNADGKLDVAVANHDGSTVSVLLGAGQGVLAPATDSPFRTFGSHPVYVAVADFNGDGKPDIVTANFSSGDVSVLLGNGQGSFARSPGSPFTTRSFHPDSLAIGDFNGDGNADVAVGNQGGNVSVLLGDGKGKLTAATGSPFGFTPTSVAVGDFNADGNADVAVANSGGGVSVLLGDGTGKLTVAAGSPVPTGGTTPAALVVGDFDSDGKADVAVANSGSGDVSVLLGDGTGGLQVAPGSPFATGGAGPGALALGDLDGDGQTDLVVANTTGASVGVLMNGRTLPGTLASFPANPVAGEQVTFVYSPRGATQALEWDLNNDGVFGDALGTEVQQSFPAPGTYTISLRVTDLDGAVSTLTRTVTVGAPQIAGSPVVVIAAPQPGLMSPFPIVRIAGRVARRGARIRLLTIDAPYGATIRVHCRGRGCPFRRMTRINARAKRAVRPTATISIAKLRRRFLGAGTILRVFVSKPGVFGKYTVLEIQARRPPHRTDLCLSPGTNNPVKCPET